MDNYLYNCQYCGNEYRPNRRKKQKYCSNSCRTRAWVIRMGLINTSKEIQIDKEKKSEGISLVGIGNAAAGTLVVEFGKRLFTKEDDKPATKGDLKKIYDFLNNRYQAINNMPNRNDGAKPFFDLQTKSVVYLTKPTK